MTQTATKTGEYELGRIAGLHEAAAALPFQTTPTRISAQSSSGTRIYPIISERQPSAVPSTTTPHRCQNLRRLLSCDLVTSISIPPTRILARVSIDSRTESLIFIPAKQKVQIVLRWELPESELPIHNSVSILNTSIFGFVVYDDTTKYQIEFPKPPVLLGKVTELDVAGDPVLGGFAPDTGSQYERYASCEEAQRLMPLCRNGHIADKEAAIAKDGWTPVGSLPRLPLPPMGALLDAGVKTCKTVYQWDYYCRKQWKK